ncbi:hypothetical protein BT96DRAFT_1002392 [Gymnopus androsaceus JB14]|uniref:Uncharacterized protein n=1 Tax=Gymnopus androsaceus JB14 TaxID=1447944 RepID=A0A6A4GYD5_9AGAR|nr:hypothetical protein BT96DRAFT_1002392 [Gymnopus androsaceus JB14]
MPTGSLYNNSFADIDDQRFGLLSEWHRGQTGQGVDNLELLLPDFDDGIQLQFSGQLQPNWKAQEVLGQAVDPTPSQYGIAWVAPLSMFSPFSPKSELGLQWRSVAQVAEFTASQHNLAPPPPANFTQSSRSVLSSLSQTAPSSKRVVRFFDCPECGGKLRSKQSLRINRLSMLASKSVLFLTTDAIGSVQALKEVPSAQRLESLDAGGTSDVYHCGRGILMAHLAFAGYQSILASFVMASVTAQSLLDDCYS